MKRAWKRDFVPSRSQRLHMPWQSLPAHLLAVILFCCGCLRGSGPGDRLADRLEQTIPLARPTPDPSDESPPQAAAPAHENSESDEFPFAEPFRANVDVERWLSVEVRTTDETGLTIRRPGHGWRLVASPGGDGYRWRHERLDEWVETDVRRRPDLRQAVEAADRVVAATAIIGLERYESGGYDDQLVGIARARDLPLNLRRAAIETLAHAAEPSPLPRLLQLWDELQADRGPRVEKDQENQSESVCPAEIHAELLRGLSRFVAPASHPRFLAALQSSAVEVQLEALDLMAAKPVRPLPAAVGSTLEQLLGDSDSRLRIAALRAIAAAQHVEAASAVRRAVYDHDLNVRLAAIEGLGHFGGKETRETLSEVIANDGDVLRAAAVATLARLGERAEVYALADDPSWRVRLAVADSLANDSSSAAVSLATKLIADRSGEVQLRTIQSICRWPASQSMPLLFAAVESRNISCRKTAIAKIAEQWPPAAGFPVLEPAETRKEALDELRRRWRAEYEGSMASSASAGEPAAPRRPLNSDVQSGESDGVLALIDRLESRDSGERFGAAEQLARWSARQPLPDSVIERLAQVLDAESDPLVWQYVLDALADRPGPPAARLACAALTVPSADVRSRACEHLEKYGGPDHASALIRLLSDPDHGVVKGAARAIGRCGATDDAAAIKPLLASADGEIRVEAAAALARLGSPSGPAALERLSLDKEARVRRSTAAAMGLLEDRLYLPTLIRLLDDETSVQRAALHALPQVVGRDIAAEQDPPPASPQECARLWKNWYRLQI